MRASVGTRRWLSEIVSPGSHKVMRPVIVFLPWLLLVACVSKPDIDVSVINTGTREIDQVEITSKEVGFHFTFGVMPPLKQATYGGALRRFPKTLQVSYVEGTIRREVVIAVPEARSASGDRELSVVFPPDGDPVAKIVVGSTFSSVVVPDSDNPQFRLYRELASAAYERDSAKVQELLSRGAPLWWDDPAVQSPMEWAALSGDVAVLAALLSRQANVPPPRLAHAFQLAAQDDHVESLRELRKHVAALDPALIEDALYGAAEHGQGPAVRYFIEEAGIPVNTPVRDAGHTMLDVAIMRSHPGLVAYLRSRGGEQVITKREASGPAPASSIADAKREYISPSGALKFAVPQLSAAVEVIEEYQPADSTAAVFFLDQNDWLVAIIYTRIRADYPKDFRMVEQRVVPTQQEMQNRYGRDTYSVDVGGNGNERYLKVVNRRPGFTGKSDLEFFRYSSGDFDPDNRCGCQRVDLHFARSGYYVQIAAIANTRTGIKREQALAKAEELAKAAFGGVQPTDTKWR